MPYNADSMPTIASGSDVATETKRKLIVYSEIFKWREIYVTDPINKSTLLIKIKEAMLTNAALINRGIVNNFTLHL